eukprot:scaffold139_cov325-Pavlova_lutheri.AAC.52
MAMHRAAMSAPSTRAHARSLRPGAKGEGVGCVQETCKGSRVKSAWFGIAVAAAWTLAAEARGAGLAVQAQEELRARLEAMPSEQARKVLEKMSVDELVDMYRATRQNAPDTVEREKEEEEFVQEDWRRAFEQEWQTEKREGMKEEESKVNEGDVWEAPVEGAGFGWDARTAMQKVERTVPGIAALLAVSAAAFVLIREGGNALLEMARDSKGEDGGGHDEASIPNPANPIDNVQEQESENGDAKQTRMSEESERVEEKQELAAPEESQKAEVSLERPAAGGRVLWTREDGNEDEDAFPQRQKSSTARQPQPRPPSRRELKKSLDIRTVPREKVESVLRKALEGSWQKDSAGQRYAKEDPWKTVFQEDEPE